MIIPVLILLKPLTPLFITNDAKTIINKTLMKNEIEFVGLGKPKLVWFGLRWLFGGITVINVVILGYKSLQYVAADIKSSVSRCNLHSIYSEITCEPLMHSTTPLRNHVKYLWLAFFVSFLDFCSSQVVWLLVWPISQKILQSTILTPKQIAKSQIQYITHEWSYKHAEKNLDSQPHTDTVNTHNPD